MAGEGRQAVATLLIAYEYTEEITSRSMCLYARKYGRWRKTGLAQSSDEKCCGFVSSKMLEMIPCVKQPQHAASFVK